MSNICELIFKNEKVFLPISAIAVDDLKCMFNIKPDRVHLKAKVKEEWKNVLSQWQWLLPTSTVNKCGICSEYHKAFFQLLCEN